VTPPYDPKLLAQRELAIPGRYQLSDVAPTIHPSLWQEVLQWLSDRFDQIWKAFFGRVHIGNTGSVAIADIAVVIVGALVVFVIFRFLVNLQIERNERNRTENSALESRRNAHALYLQACELSRKGEFSAAVRVLFLAAVVALDLRGIIHDDVSSTVGDVRRHLRGKNAALVPAFDEVARPFVYAAYAETPIDLSAWNEASAGCFGDRVARAHWIRQPGTANGREAIGVLQLRYRTEWLSRTLRGAFARGCYRRANRARN
jgi:hypothetical protein